MKTRGRPLLRRAARTVAGSVGALGIGLMAFAGVGYASEDAASDSLTPEEGSVATVEPATVAEPVEAAADPAPEPEPAAEAAPEVVSEPAAEESPAPSEKAPAADPAEEAQEEVAAPADEPVVESAAVKDEAAAPKDADDAATEDPAAKTEEQENPAAEAVAVATITIDSVVRDGCLVTINTKTTGSGDFLLNIRDDGKVLWSDAWSDTQDGTHTSVWTITNPAGKEAPGIGIVVYADGSEAHRIDPWEYPDDVADNCSAAVPVEVTLPGYDPAEGVEPGASVAISGSGFLAEETVVFIMAEPSSAAAASTAAPAGTVVGQATTSESGAFSGAFTVPEGTSPGAKTITVYGESSFRSDSAGFKVVAAPQELDGGIVDITRNGCLVSISVKTSGIGEFEVAVWDDSQQIFVDKWTTTTDTGTHTTVWTITEPAGTSAPGVGIFLSSDTRRLDGVDPWEYPDEVADNCSAEVPVTVTLPGYDDAIGAKPSADVPIEGTGFLPGETVTFTIGGVAVGSAEADTDGAFKGTFKVPADAVPGTLKVTAKGEQSFRSKTVEFRILGATPAPTPEAQKPAPAAPAEGLAKTGASTGVPLMLMAAAMVLSGGIMLSLRRS